MRLISGNAPTDVITATSEMIPVVPSTLYTTTSNLRFLWTGDPNPTGPPPSRPQVFITILYFQANAMPSTLHAQNTFSYFQEDSTTGFATFPLQYTVPSDSVFVELQFGASRNGLPNPIQLDVDNVR